MFFNFFFQAGSESIAVDDFKVLAQVICEGQEAINLYLTTLIVCLVLMMTLFLCSFIIFRIKSRKQQDSQVLSSAVINDDINYSQNSVLSRQTGLIRNDLDTQQNVYPLGPPIGSTQAEFQNDFIAVFPMHHLEPLPEKNNMSY